MGRVADFWEELKRRRLIRVAIGYGAVAFTLLQVAPVIQQGLRMPDWVTNLTVVLSLIGFPVAMLVAWMVDLHATLGRAWLIVVAVAAVLAGAALLGWRIERRIDANAANGPAPAAASSTALAPGPLAITDPPPPKTTSPEAAGEYAAAMQLWRDGAVAEGARHLARAVEIDPGFAAAHMRLAVPDLQQSDEIRKHIAAAGERRAQLSDRDQAMLECFRADWASGLPDRKPTWQRWKALSDRFPLDAEIAEIAGIQGVLSSEGEAAFAMLDRAIELDPKFAWPYVTKAASAKNRGDRDGALAIVEKCLTVSPRATACVRRRAEISATRGDCAKLEEDARAMITAAPDGSLGYAFLASALVSLAAPAESVADAIKRQSELASGSEGAQNALFAPLVPPLLAGDLTGLVAGFPAIDRLRAAQTSTALYGALTNIEYLTLREEGAADRGLALIEESVRRLPALTPDDPVFEFVALTIRRRAGRVGDDVVRSKREALVVGLKPLLPPELANHVWFLAWAGVAFNPDEAREALDALPRFSPLPVLDEVDLRAQENLGRVLLLAGKARDAVTHLRRAASECFAPADLVVHLNASEELGEALEATGERDGACKSYADVLSRWGHARPRSITADAARTHAKKLGCPG
jgi:serine/threonine-protein kinase